MPRDHQPVLTWPNVVSLVALGLALSALIGLWHWSLSVTFGLALCSFVADVVDGWLARRMNIVSPAGTYLDLLVDVCLYLLYPAAIWTFVAGLVSWPAIGATTILIGAGLFRLIRFTQRGLVTTSSGLYYQGLPVFMIYPLLFILFAWQRFGWPALVPVSIVLMIICSWLMVLQFKFPKPKNIVPVVVLAVAAALYFFTIRSL